MSVEISVIGSTFLAGNTLSAKREIRSAVKYFPIARACAIVGFVAVFTAVFTAT